MHECSDSSSKTTKTIYIDWSGDEEQVCQISYISNNELLTIWAYDGIDSIEAEGGVVVLDDGGMLISSYTSNFISLLGPGARYRALFAKQDGETIYPVSSGDQ